MAALKGCSALVTGGNRGLGLEMVKQLLEAQCSKVFAGCRDPDGPNSEALRELAKKHPDVITLVKLDVSDPGSIKESAQKVGSLLGKNGLNLILNNAAVLPQKTMLTTTVEDMINTFNTNVIGPLFVIREYLPYLKTAAKASGKPGMSCDKAAVINISTDASSMAIMPVLKEPFPLFPYSISKAGLNMLTIYTARDFKADEILCISIHPGWVRTDMGGDKAPIDARQSVEGVLSVVSSLTEKQHGGFLDYTGKTMPW
ncbi:C-factor-like protein [Labeo rohita]|uniref:C-factor-like protein n=1 Tax=Labeo rohita TaxID=84645 RepID=A0A498MJI4_LABRO|nr:C-factor-like [Labeo rohita]RXN19953.1 C-factor-like protein [Labeo rohita]